MFRYLRLISVSWLLSFALQVYSLPAYAESDISVNNEIASEEYRVLIDQPLTPENTRDLLARLSDSQVREILLQRLDDSVQSQATPEELEPWFERFSHGTLLTLRHFVLAFERLSDYPEALSQLYSQLSKDEPSFLKHFSLGLGLAFLSGLGVAGVLSFFTRGLKASLANIQSSTLQGRIKSMSLCICIDLSLVLAFFFVAVMTVNQWFNDVLVLSTVNGLLVAFSSLGVVYFVARFLLAPNNPALRLLTCDDQGARFLFRQVMVIAALGIFGDWFLVWTYQMGAEPGDLLFGFWIQIMMLSTIVYTIWFSRRSLTQMLIGDDANVTAGLKVFARYWPYLCAGLVGFLALVNEIIVANGMLDMIPRGADGKTLLLIILIPAFETAIRSVACHLFPGVASDEESCPGQSEACQKTREGIVRFGRVTLFSVFFLLLAEIWGVDLFDLAGAGWAITLFATLVEILVTVFMAYGLWELFDIYYQRQMAFERALVPKVDSEEPGGGEGGGSGGTRLSTILPLFRWTVLSVITVVVVFTVLGQLGVSVAPIIAGAGVLGLAIGFGAQTLVKDIVSGVFFLIDDAFRVGEYIEIEGTVGSVEKISIRSLRLRHHRGAVHTIPYGEIPKLTNYSRDWVIMKLKFRVPFDTDINKVKKLFKVIGKDLLDHPEIGEDFLQPFKSQGVLELDDSGMVVRGKFMTKPGKQFMARKEIFMRVQKAFAENGIEFARREVLVHVPGLDDGKDLSDGLSAEGRKAIAAAAHDVAQQHSSENSVPPLNKN